MNNDLAMVASQISVEVVHDTWCQSKQGELIRVLIY